jgi:hypothetical protein
MEKEPFLRKFAEIFEFSQELEHLISMQVFVFASSKTIR